MNQFIKGIITFSLKNRLMVFLGTLLIIAWGVQSFLNTPIEAFPDVINTRVVIITQWPGRSAEELEKFVTIPIETEMNVVPSKTSLRSISLFGLSVVTLFFEDEVDDFRARQMVSNQLVNVSLPAGADPEIQPPSGPTGEIYRYTLEGTGKTVRDLKEVQDWVIDKRLKAVQGIADVISFGGEVKIYEVTIDPNRLIAYDFGANDVFTAVQVNNGNVGGDVVERGSQAFLVRGIGLVNSIDDIENIIIKNINGAPIRVKDVASVNESFKPRLGKVGRGDETDVVEGIVLLRKGENPSQVLKDLNTTIFDLNDRVLPDGIKIKVFYDRTTLVNLTTHTVMDNLIVGMLLVTFILSVFLLAAEKRVGALGVEACEGEAVRRELFRRRADAAARTVSSRSIADSSRKPRTPTEGLLMISTAPFSRARIAASVVGPVREEQITTGIGFSAITLRKKVMPSMFGISRSKRITSGRNFFIF